MSRSIWPRCSVISLNNGASFRPIQFDATSASIQIRYLDDIDNYRAYWRKLSAFNLWLDSSQKRTRMFCQMSKGTSDRFLAPCFFTLDLFLSCFHYLACLTSAKKNIIVWLWTDRGTVKRLLIGNASTASISSVTRSSIPRALSNFPARVLEGKRWLTRMI